jgi:hypothetical protein
MVRAGLSVGGNLTFAPLVATLLRLRHLRALRWPHFRNLFRLPAALCCNTGKLLSYVQRRHVDGCLRDAWGLLWILCRCVGTVFVTSLLALARRIDDEEPQTL